jgi:hypothetical protein
MMKLINIALIVLIVVNVGSSQRTSIEAPGGRAKVPLRNYAPLVGEEIYGKQQLIAATGATGASNDNSGDVGNRCCTPRCECQGVVTCCAQKIKLIKAQVVKRGTLDPKDFVLQPNNRDTKTVSSIGPCPHPGCPDDAKKIGTSANSPMYPKDNDAPEEVVITKSTLPTLSSSRKDTVHLCPCCFKATTDPSIKCNCCGSIGN